MQDEHEGGGGGTVDPRCVQGGRLERAALAVEVQRFADLTGEQAVVGETPNLAARLQELAPANAVLVM